MTTFHGVRRPPPELTHGSPLVLPIAPRNMSDTEVLSGDRRQTMVFTRVSGHHVHETVLFILHLSPRIRQGLFLLWFLWGAPHPIKGWGHKSPSFLKIIYRLPPLPPTPFHLEILSYGGYDAWAAAETDFHEFQLDFK